jgi:hypothetical protein
MNRAALWSSLSAVPLFSAGLFLWQNYGRITDLFFDLKWAAWHFAAPVSVSVLLSVAVLSGLLVGALLFALPMVRLKNKVRRLEQELALSAGRNDGSW